MTLLTRWHTSKRVESLVGSSCIVLIDRFAFSYGRRSLLGKPPLIPTGCLVLTDDEVVFMDHQSNAVERFPLRSITSAAPVEEFRGCSGWARDLFQIEFSDRDGRTNAAAWRVHDETAWAAKTTARMSNEVAAR